jgi:hypothetical protein
MSTAAPSANGSAFALRVAEVQRTIDLVRRGSAAVELRILNIRPKRGRPYNASGYFKDSEKAARAALQYECLNPEGIYLVVNEVDPECWPRSPEKVTDYQETTTSDGDVLGRKWLFLDCDPKRPRGVCATAAQVAAAVERAAVVRDFLREEYAWPAPVEALSGNGAYLLYAIDLPNDDDSKRLLTAVLAAVEARAQKTEVPEGTPAVKVDQATFNAARVMRLVGTRNAKGHSTQDQPHRQSRLTAVPEPLVELTLEQLKAVAADAPQKQAAGTGGPRPQTNAAGGGGRQWSRLDVPRWLAARGVEFREKPGGTADGRACWLIRCPFDAGHGGHGECCIMLAPEGRPSAKCMHDSCQGRGWKEFSQAIGPPEGDLYDPPLKAKRKSAGRKAKPSAPAEGIPLGPLTLRPDVPKQTPSGKVVVPFTVWQGDKQVDQLRVTDTTSSRKEVQKALALHLAGDEKALANIAAALAALIVAAVASLKQAAEQTEEEDLLTMQETLAQIVPGELGINGRTDKGLWSEARGGDITHFEFCRYLSSALVDACAEAGDAPLLDSGEVDRPALLRQVKAELEVLWGDLQKEQRPIAEVQLGKNSALGKRFWAAMVRLWTKTMTFEVSKSVEGTSGEAVAARASLVSRVKTQAKPYLEGKARPEAREGWRDVQRGFDAWWRPYLTPDGEIRILLAMRWRLMGQVGIELPGVTDQASLTDEGERLGALDESPPVKVRLHAGTRLAMLSPDITAELLERIAEEPEAAPSGDTVTAGSASPGVILHPDGVSG